MKMGTDNRLHLPVGTPAGNPIPDSTSFASCALTPRQSRRGLRSPEFRSAVFLITTALLLLSTAENPVFGSGKGDDRGSSRSVSPGVRAVKVIIAATSDVHGSLFPYDYEEDRPGGGSLAGVHHLADSLRHSGAALVLLENGDLLQGTPVAYFANFVQQKRNNLFPRVLNTMKYDAANVGNHDIEAGPAVYTRVAKELRAPYLGANILSDTTGEPHFRPYTVIRRQGITIAVLGMTTPSIPEWLPPQMWQGLTFTDMLPEARKWVEIIKRNENPDIIVGLFHTGYGTGEPEMAGKPQENAGRSIIETIPGFDLVILGHDHRRRNEWFTRSDSSRVLILNPGNGATHLAVAQFSLVMGDGGKPRVVAAEGELLKVPENPGPNRVTRRFRKDRQAIREFSNRRVGTLGHPLTGAEALFGNSPFLDLIHRIQLEATGADLSLAAPLSISGTIPAGDLHVRDLFRIYRFENFLYTMQLTGLEIKNHLEYSYGLWLNTMTSPGDNLLLFREDSGISSRLAHPYYNFDSAAGIRYTVDISKPPGERITIPGFENGAPFNLRQNYRVAVNSYRGSGGGGHLTMGAGIPRDKLAGRILSSTPQELRSIMISHFENHGTITPEAGDNWQIIPATWAQEAITREKPLFH